MVAFHESAPIPVVCGASVPGGMAPHIRVQFQQPDLAGWQLYAICASRQEAEDCLRQLQRQGRKVRLVNYRCCSTAA